jgi:hypothetical protein
VKVFPRINRFDLEEALKYNFIKKSDMDRLIRDPNKIQILFKHIDPDSPTTKKILKHNPVISYDDIYIESFQEFQQGFKAKEINTNQLKFNN